MAIDLFAWLRALLRWLGLGGAPKAPAPRPRAPAPLELDDPAPAAPLLSYAAAPFPFPLQASAAGGPPSKVTLTVTASNLTSASVTLQAVAITLPVGTGAGELTADSGSISPVPPLGWTMGTVQNPPGGVQYVFLAPQAGAAVAADQSLAFVFDTVEVNTVPGPFTLGVMEGSGGCSPPACPSTTLPLTKFPSGWGQVTFSASNDTVVMGTPVTLAWQGPAGATYVLDFYLPQTGVVVVPAAGAPKLGNDGVYPGTADPPLVLEQTTVFNLTVTDNVGETEYTAKSQYTVDVEEPPPAISSFAAVPAWVDMTQPPVSVQLAWTATGASELSIDGVGSFTGAAAAQGTAPVYPTATATWFATAYGLPGYSGPPATAQATVQFGGSSSTGEYSLIDMNQTSGPWTLAIEGQNVLTLSLVFDPNYNETYLWATPAAGMMMADLGTAQGGTGVGTAMNAQYTAPLAALNLWWGGFQDQYYDDNLVNGTATWGVQLGNGRTAVVWYSVANVVVNFNTVHRNFTFSWICYGPLSR